MGSVSQRAMSPRRSLMIRNRLVMRDTREQEIVLEQKRKKTIFILSHNRDLHFGLEKDTTHFIFAIAKN